MPAPQTAPSTNALDALKLDHSAYLGQISPEEISENLKSRRAS